METHTTELNWTKNESYNIIIININIDELQKVKKTKNDDLEHTHVDLAFNVLSSIVKINDFSLFWLFKVDAIC